MSTVNNLGIGSTKPKFGNWWGNYAPRMPNIDVRQLLEEYQNRRNQLNNTNIPVSTEKLKSKNKVDKPKKDVLTSNISNKPNDLVIKKPSISTKHLLEKPVNNNKYKNKGFKSKSFKFKSNKEKILNCSC